MNKKDITLKRYLFMVGLATVVITSLSSCASYKKDCQGVRHTRLSNGVVI